MTDEVKFMSQEDIKAGIDRGDPEILNGMINNTIRVGEPEPVIEPVNEEVENAPDLIEPPETVLEENGKEEEPSKDDDEYEKKVEALRLARHKDKALFQEESEKSRAKALELEEQKKKLEEEVQALRAAAEKKNIAVEEDVVEDSDDPLEPDYSKAIRKKVSDLENQVTQTGNNDVILNEIKELKDAWAEQKRIDEANKRKDRETKVFKEIEDFQSKNSLFRTNKNIKDLASNYKLLHSEVSDYVKSIDPNSRDEDVLRAVNAIVRGSTPTDIKFRQRAEKAGIIVPREMDKFMQIADIVDLKSGKQFNSITGRLEDVTDDEGNPVYYRSIDEAFKIYNYDNDISEVKKKVAKQYQEKKDRRDQSAITLDNSVVSSVEETAVMDLGRIKQILAKDPKEIRKNPALMEEYRNARKALNLE